MYGHPAAPAWTAARYSPSMWIDPRFLCCVQFLGGPTERGFLAHGSAFFVSVTEEGLTFTYAVTCRHVISTFGDDKQDTISLRIGRLNGKRPRIIPTRKAEWM